MRNIADRHPLIHFLNAMRAAFSPLSHAPLAA
jgi:hypothetical protein